MRVAIISDIHSNLPALLSVIEDMEKRGVEKVICVGDLIGYGPYPNEVVEKIKEIRAICVVGNHDFHTNLNGLEYFNFSARRALIWNSKQLTKENKRFINGLEKTKRICFDERQIFLVHGSPLNPLYEYVFPSTSEEIFSMYLSITQSDILLMGHTHIPFIKTIGQKVIMNPGSVGQPRDHNPKASYGILDLNTIESEIIRVKYNIDKIAKEIITAGLPHSLARRLYVGI